jgi:hypothetical protein
MDFSDKTNTKDMFDVKDSSSTRGGISFETTQQISVDKFNEYQKNKEQESALGLNNQNQNESNLNLKKTNRGIDSKTRDKFEEISKEFSKKPSSKGASFLKFIFFIIFVLLGVFAFVLYKNNWQVNFDKLPEMVKVAFNGGSLENSTPIKKNKVKSLKDQFFIDSKKIKTDLIKISNRGKNKKYAVVVSGELKNTDDTKKSLTTVNVKIDSILDKKTILEKRVYAGNIFTANEIIKAKTSENLDAEYLQSGKNGSNWAVLPGKTTPFMVVFYLDKSINLKEIKIKIEVMSTQ